MEEIGTIMTLNLKGDVGPGDVRPRPSSKVLIKVKRLSEDLTLLTIYSWPTLTVGYTPELSER